MTLEGFERQTEYGGRTEMIPGVNSLQGYYTFPKEDSELAHLADKEKAVLAW